MAKKVKCDVCSKMGDGVKFNLSDKFIDKSESERVERIFGKTEFHVCFVCWLKSLGVKEKGKGKK